MKILIFVFLIISIHSHAQLKATAKKPSWGGYWWSMRNAETALGWDGIFGTKTWTKKEVEDFSKCLGNWKNSCDLYLKNKSPHLSPLMKFDLYVYKLLNKAGAFISPTTVAQSSIQELKIHHINSPDHPHYNASNYAGKCIGWALSTLEFNEPIKSKEIKGILFIPSDIKAILATLYNGAQFFVPEGSYVGEAYYDGGTEAAEEDVLPKDFILALQKNIGKNKKALVADLASDTSAWNYPIFAYEITFKKSGTIINGMVKIIYADDEVDIDATFSNSSKRKDHLTSELEFSAKIPANWKGQFKDVISSKWMGAAKDKHPDSLVLGLEKNWKKSILEYRNTDIKKEFNFQILKKINLGDGWIVAVDELLKE